MSENQKDTKGTSSPNGQQRNSKPEMNPDNLKQKSNSSETEVISTSVKKNPGNRKQEEINSEEESNIKDEEGDQSGAESLISD